MWEDDVTRVDRFLRPLVVALAGALVLAAATPPTLASADPLQVLTPPTPARRTVVASADGVKLIAYEWGNPAGPPILFIHGSFQSSLSWMDQAADPRLTAKYRLIAFDLRGHGASDKPDDPAAYRDGARWAGDVAAVIGDLHLDRPVVVAWSYGARVLDDYLQAYGDRRLSGIIYVDARSIGAIPGAPATTDPEAARIAKQALSDDPAPLAKASREFVLLCLQKPIPAHQIDLLTSASLKTPAYVRRAMSGRPLAYEAVLKAIDVPVLIVQGDADRVVAPAISQYTLGLIVGSSQSLYPGVGHSPFLEDPARFDAELEAFMGHVWPAPIPPVRKPAAPSP